MSARHTVHVTMIGLVKLQDGINYRQERVVLATDPAVAKYPDYFRELGTVDDEGVAYIVMLGDAAVLPRVEHLITPMGVEPPMVASSVEESDPAPTPFARTTIPEIKEVYQRLARSLKRPPSKRLTAQRVGIDRDTITDWVSRGWMTWPPI